MHHKLLQLISLPITAVKRVLLWDTGVSQTLHAQPGGSGNVHGRVEAGAFRAAIKQTLFAQMLRKVLRCMQFRRIAFV